MKMTFHSLVALLKVVFLALEQVRLLVDHAIVSDASRRWQRILSFLHFHAWRL
jgi:hypothetical protein